MLILPWWSVVVRVFPVLILRLDWAGRSVSLEAGRVQYGQTERRHTGGVTLLWPADININNL